MRAGFSGFSALFEMLENLFDDRRILDTGNNLDGAATIATKTIQLERDAIALGGRASGD